MPVVKKRKHAEEEEDPTYQHQEVSESETEDSSQEEEVMEEEEENDEESGVTSNDEEELPSTSQSLAEVIDEENRKKKKAGVKRKHENDKKKPAQKTTRVATVVKTTKTSPASTVSSPGKKIRKVVRKHKGNDKPDSADGSKKSPNLSVEYNDKNVDYNLYNEAPEHIKNLKIKISSNVIMLCRMIEATGNTSQGLTYDYAALSFVRQSKNGKAYEFNLPLNLAPSIVKGITLLIKQNPKFFDKQFQTIQPEEIE